MPKVMLTVELSSEDATVEGARSKLGLSEDDLDPGFGVVQIDPERNLYAVLVEEDAAARAEPGGLAGGPYANPKIEPFGPPQRGNESGGGTSTP